MVPVTFPITFLEKVNARTLIPGGVYTIPKQLTIYRCHCFSEIKK
jgi:hypothetical protein